MSFDHTPLDTTPITISGRCASQIAELLSCCEALLRQASPTARAEMTNSLDQHCTVPDLGWLIDMLGFDTLFLQAKLAVAAESAGNPRR